MTKLLVIVAAHNEADRIGATLDALAGAFPGAVLWVGDDASDDRTADLALAHRARVVRRGRPHGKGANATAAAEAALSDEAGATAELVLLCDGDLGESAAQLVALVTEVDDGRCDLAVAAFRQRVGGGFGVALQFARWAIRSRSGYEARAPICRSRKKAMTRRIGRPPARSAAFCTAAASCATSSASGGPGAADRG